MARLRQRFVEQRDDGELGRDAAMLPGYRRVPAERTQWEHDEAIRGHLARSLSCAGRMKLPPGPPHEPAEGGPRGVTR